MEKGTGLLLFLFLLPVGIHAECVGTRGVAFPKLPTSYQTVIEINMDNKDYSILEREYRDGDGKRTMISQLINKTSRVIMEDANKQAIHINITDSTCTVTDLSETNPGDHPFGGINKANGEFIYSTEKVFSSYKIKDDAVLVKKSEKVRGVDAEHWCSSFKFKNRDLELHMYFSAATWKTAGAFPQKPVRFALTENSTKTDAFNYNYEYYAFFPEIRDDPMTLFEPPPGVICKGRKGNKKIPKLPTYFSYRGEVVYDTYVKTSDIWYDEKERLLRIDYRPGGIGASETAAVSEVHDYNTGVRYVKNLYLGNCSASTITNSSFGTEQNATMWKKDKSYEVLLKNPLQYFYLDKNYVYVGKRMTRQIECDVFATTRKSFMMPDGKKHQAVLEFYFASNKTIVMPDRANNITVQVPVMMLVTSKDALSLRINIVDFNEKKTDFSVFDVSSCYSPAAKMHVTILMDGQYVESTKEEIIGEGKVLIADLMKIRRNRVQDVDMSHDAASIALTASILSRAPPAAQFSHISKKTHSVKGDKTWKGVSSMSECAEKCVQNDNFVCNSFDICGADCILSKNHIQEQVTSGGTVTCDHYSRTVDGPKIKEIDSKTAWYNLREAIAQGSFSMEIPNDTGESFYKATFSRLDFGIISPINDIPKLRNSLKYKEEIVSPSKKTIIPISVYYDARKNLTRFDSVGIINCPGCLGPVESVQDFQLGVQYNIDKWTGECHAEQFQADIFDVINGDPSKKKLMKMKDALGLFYIDGTYSYAGQKEVRGIMTDIFEAWRTDFPNSDDVLFRYYFLSKEWNSISSSTPVRLDIVSDKTKYNAVYNFFGFIEGPVPMSNFDVTECYRSSDSVIDFQMAFDGVYTEQPANFILAVINKIKAYTTVSGVRIQEPEISYDSKRTYFQASLLEPPPSIAMFTRVPFTSAVPRPYYVAKNIESPEACADQCVKTKDLTCNAFQFCLNSKRCELHHKHFGDSNTEDSNACSFYSRTEDAPVELVSAKEVMTDLINLAQKGMFKIDFTAGISTYSFTANSVLTNIDRDNSKDISAVQNMKSYRKPFEGAYIKQYNTVFTKISIDDCATRCTMSKTLDCEAFSYCWLQGQCQLSENHPTNETVELTPWCDIYERKYLTLFEVLPGKTFPMKGREPVADVTDPEHCARLCFDKGVGDCQSFQYCKDQKYCSFSSKHTMDVPSSDMIGSEECSIYSITFLKDFVKASTKIVNPVNNILIRNATVKECARICLTDEGLNCDSFDYCPSDRICRIKGIDEYNKGKIPGVTQLNCSHFIRTDKKVVSPLMGLKQIKGNQGTATGLGIGMFLLGTVLGLLVIFLVHTRGKTSKEDHMKVNFLKMEDQ